MYAKCSCLCHTSLRASKVRKGRLRRRCRRETRGDARRRQASRLDSGGVTSAGGRCRGGHQGVRNTGCDGPRHTLKYIYVLNSHFVTNLTASKHVHTQSCGQQAAGCCEVQRTCSRSVSVDLTHINDFTVAAIKLRRYFSRSIFQFTSSNRPILFTIGLLCCHSSNEGSQENRDGNIRIEALNTEPAPRMSEESDLSLVGLELQPHHRDRSAHRGWC